MKTGRSVLISTSAADGVGVLLLGTAPGQRQHRHRQRREFPAHRASRIGWRFWDDADFCRFQAWEGQRGRWPDSLSSRGLWRDRCPGCMAGRSIRCNGTPLRRAWPNTIRYWCRICPAAAAPRSRGAAMTNARSLSRCANWSINSVSAPSSWLATIMAPASLTTTRAWTAPASRNSPFSNTFFPVRLRAGYDADAGMAHREQLAVGALHGPGRGGIRISRP